MIYLTAGCIENVFIHAGFYIQMDNSQATSQIMIYELNLKEYLVNKHH